MKSIFEIEIPNATNSFAKLEGKWERKRNWDWNGIIIADKPIIAISFLRVGNRIEWARSQKQSASELDARLLLGIFDSDPKDVQVVFSFGANGPRWRTVLDDSNQPPDISNRAVAIGKSFAFCKSFGTPAIELFGLVIFREQAVCARNGLWHIKKEYKDLLPDDCIHILSYGRAGRFNLEN